MVIWKKEKQKHGFVIMDPFAANTWTKYNHWAFHNEWNYPFDVVREITRGKNKLVDMVDTQWNRDGYPYIKSECNNMNISCNSTDIISNTRNMAHSSCLRTFVSHPAFDISGFDWQLRFCILYFWLLGPLGVFVGCFARSIRRLFNQECCCIRLRCSVVEDTIRASCCHVRETHLSCSSALQPAGFQFFEWFRMCHILLVYERLICSGSCPGHEGVCVSWR